jgi:hypothetical protein
MWAIDDAISYAESLDDNSLSARAAELQAKTEREVKAPSGPIHSAESHALLRKPARPGWERLMGKGS